VNDTLRLRPPVDLIGDPRYNIWAVLSLAVWHHVAYITVIYLAWLQTIDPTLKEAAALDGANAWHTFWHVSFPGLRNAHIFVVVATAIEAMRSFDIPYTVNHGRNGLELISTLITENVLGEASRIGFGSALAVMLLVVSLASIVTFAA